MTKQVLYVYLGTNGTIISPVHLEDAYYVRKLFLRADPGKVLTKDGKTFVTSVKIPESDEQLWMETEKPTGQK